MVHISDQAFADNVRALERTAFSICYLLLKSEADCEDAIGRAILKAYEKRHQLKEISAFRAWFLAIVKNESMSILRARRRVVPLDEWRESAAPSRETLDLYDALDRLPEAQKLVLLLRGQGYRVDEIAAILSVPSGTVKSRIHRAKAAIQTEYQEESL